MTKKSKDLKLIKLLNLYMDDWKEWMYACESYDPDFKKFFHTKDGEFLDAIEIISKDFWFIDWLVANDYIVEHRAVFSPMEWRNIYIGDYYIPTVNNSLMDSIIAFLAVADDPLPTLISILK